MINFSLNTCWRLIPTFEKAIVLEINMIAFLTIITCTTFAQHRPFLRVPEVLSGCLYMWFLLNTA